MVSARHIFLLLTLHTVLVLSLPLGCRRKCLPVQWEAAVLGTIGQVMKGKSHVFELAGKISVDYKSHSQVFSTLVYMNKRIVADTTVLTTAKALYSIDNINKKCVVLPGFGVEQLCSDNEHLNYKTSWTIGCQMTDTYTTNKGDETKSTLTVLRDSFTVVSQVLQQNLPGLQQMTALAFGNTTQGIKDPSVFKVPSSCLKTIAKRDVSAANYINPLV